MGYNMANALEKSTKLFWSGRSQAVRLPASFRFDCEEVKIRKDPISGDVVISPLRKNWDSFIQLASTTTVPSDFLDERNDDAPQTREVL